ncbi:hypothetical protein GCM10023080_071930 [Streptomyces pseudoechinosporeus]
MAAAAVALSLCAVATGCTAGSEDISSGSAAKAAQDAYSDCLADQGLVMEKTTEGIEVPDKTANSPEALDSGTKRCAHLIPGDQSSPPAEILAQAREESKCMRANGVEDYPDPDPGTADIALSDSLGERLKSDPEALAAVQKCLAGNTNSDGTTIEGG